jgi:hypothetical protein
MSTLVDQARHVIAQARKRAAGAELAARLADAEDRLDEPLRVAVAGRVKAGKSTLVNAMVGELIAPTDARECTRIVTWYRDGVTYRVEGVGNGGERAPLRFDRDGAALEIDLGDRLPAQLASIEVTWPSSRLREMTLVDTPGIDSLSLAESSSQTERFLTGDGDRPMPTDAVLYLLRHVHGGDLRFLEAFHDDRLATANPLNSIGVLSRADEIGSARPDALDSARRIATRWRGDRRLAALVQTVVPVAGLLAEAASTLRQVEFDAFAVIARADRALVDEVLVSADRFGGSAAPIGIVDLERRALLDRFGLFGCRLAVAAIGSGEVTTAAGLADRLLDASGLPALRAEIADRFTRRRDLLKARHALLTTRQVALASRDGALLREVERVLDGAHEFAELRVLNALRRGGLELGEARIGAARRLLGEAGTDVDARLGLQVGAGADDVRSALVDQLAMWQDQAEHPLAGPDTAAAARVLVRTCEGLLAVTAVAETA